ncbi:MAG: matrixin family metalloprotease, partial [Pirellulaceae bacterium]|nr:matrixin family metalloprotease [Pirellulaceae bacterium]
MFHANEMSLRARSESRRSQPVRSRRRLRLEPLEVRLLLAADLEAHPLFAPGTPLEYVQQFEHLQAEKDGELAGIDLFQFNDSDRWSGTSQSGGGLGQGDPTTISWSIVPDGTNINGFIGEPQSPSDFVSTFRGYYGLAHDPQDTNYVGEAWFEAIAASFDRWSDLTGLTYVYEPNDDGANFAYYAGASGVRGDVRIGGHPLDGNSGTLAYNFYPNTSDMVIDTSDSFYTNTGGSSLRLRNVVMHEAGHGLGIAHVESSTGAFLMEPFINLGFDGPQFDDILAAHRGYGDRFEPNDAAATATGLGSLAAGQSVSVGQDAADLGVAAADVSFVSIDDDSDVDYYSFTVGANASVDVIVTPLGPTYNQGPQGGSQSAFNAAAQNNLAIAVIGPNGSTVLAAADANGLGGSEAISNLPLTTAGTYYVAVSGGSNAAQFYQLTLTAGTSAPQPGITLTESNGSTEVAEGGATDSYSLVLDTQPAADVTITLGAGSQLAVVPATLTFTPANWSQAQTVSVSAVDDDVVEGAHGGTITHSVTSADSGYQGLAVANVTVSIADNDQAPPADEFYFSVQSNSTINGLAVSDEDIVAFDGVNVRLLFDGSDVGLGGERISAFDVISPTEILLSFETPWGSVDDSDIVLFVATSLGDNTAGAFYWYLDGSDVGLSTNGEDLDALTLLDDGSLLLSTIDVASVPGRTFQDEDVFRFIPTSLGTNTSGSFVPFFDGSDANKGLSQSSNEDVDGLAVQGSKLYLSTLGNFSVPGGVIGEDDDVFVYDTATGAYEPALFFNLSGNDLWGLDFPGTASAAALGLGGGGSLIHPDVPRDWTVVSPAITSHRGEWIAELAQRARDRLLGQPVEAGSLLAPALTRAIESLSR